VTQAIGNSKYFETQLDKGANIDQKAYKKSTIGGNQGNCENAPSELNVTFPDGDTT
jgi:hypothetical protein